MENRDSDPRTSGLDYHSPSEALGLALSRKVARKWMDLILDWTVGWIFFIFAWILAIVVPTVCLLVDHIKVMVDDIKKRLR